MNIIDTRYTTAEASINIGSIFLSGRFFTPKQALIAMLPLSIILNTAENTNSRT